MRPHGPAAADLLFCFPSRHSCGDYASGTNHTLPTYGFARQFSGVNTLSFQKHITSQRLTKEGIRGLGPVVIRLAECEGLEAHAYVHKRSSFPNAVSFPWADSCSSPYPTNSNAVRVRLAALAEEDKAAK